MSDGKKGVPEHLLGPMFEKVGNALGRIPLLLQLPLTMLIIAAAGALILEISSSPIRPSSAFEALTSGMGINGETEERRSGLRPTPTPLPDCTDISPPHDTTVGGTFEVVGHCPSLAGQRVFLFMKDVFPYPNIAPVDHASSDESAFQPGHWIQCDIKVKKNGDFHCGAFACFDGARYEILIVSPQSPEAESEYDKWFDEASHVGRIRLPSLDEIELIGGNRVVTISHSISPPSPKCLELRLN